jgi:hypothetical protein
MAHVTEFLQVCFGRLRCVIAAVSRPFFALLATALSLYLGFVAMTNIGFLSSYQFIR